MSEKRCCECEHFGLSKDPIFRVITGICGRCGKEVGYTDKCLFEEERNDDDIKFKLITYVDTDFEAKTQKCEYFIELEDGVERSLKDILIENVKLKEQQVTISKLEEEKEYWKSKAMTLLMQVRRLTSRMTAKEVIEFGKELEDE